jgi:hypothetical protein
MKTQHFIKKGMLIILTTLTSTLLMGMSPLMVNLENLETSEVNAFTISNTLQAMLFNADSPGMENNNTTITMSSEDTFNNYPDPFSSTTTIYYEIQYSGPVSLKVFNGSTLVAILFTDVFHFPGTYSMVWNAEGMENGAYTGHLETSYATLLEPMQKTDQIIVSPHQSNGDQ